MINSEKSMDGYKKTKLGLIPEEWDVQSLMIASKKLWIGLVTTMTTNYVDHGIPMIKNSDINPMGIKSQSLIHLEKEFASKHSHRSFLKGDIATVHTGDVGVSAVIQKELEGAIGFATLNTRWDENKFFNKYVFYYFNSHRFLHTSVAFSTGDGRQNLNLKDFRYFLIPKPSLKEQEKIAEILSTWDEAIRKTEALIKKKEKLKKGLMQQLLHPKDNWETYQIKELFTFHRSISASRKDLVSESSSNDILNIHYGDVHTLFNDAIQLDVSESENLNAFVDGYKLPNTVDYARNGDVIIVDASEDYEGVAECFELTNIDEKTVTAGLHTFLLRPKAQKTVSGFRSLIFKAPVSRKEIKRLVTGSNVFGLSKTNLSKLEVSIPPKDEQKKIVNVLSFAEREINDLVKLKEQQEYQKKGLMQQLLTGKTRVTVN